MKIQNLNKILYYIVIFIYFLLFFKTAWVCDDAYINFRSLDQLYAGNGPTWNPGERVQVYTSVLWYWILASVCWIYDDYYIISIIISFILFTILSYHFAAFAKNKIIICVLIIIAASSRSFYDFSSSGLESMLCSLLTLLFSINYFKYNEANSSEKQKYYNYVLIIFSLIPLCRHDLTTLLIIPFFYIIYTNNSKTIKQRLIDCIYVFCPLIIWSIFSTIYYGMPLPNTAYAKLHTGINKLSLIKQGLIYLKYSFIHEPIMIFIFLVPNLFSLIKGKNYSKIFSCGIILNLVYVISVGGDFMTSRFILSAAIASTALLLNLKILDILKDKHKHIFRVTILILICYLLIFNNTTLNVPYNFSSLDIPEHGVVDERKHYNDVSSIYQWYISRNNYLLPTDNRPFFPMNELSVQAYYYSKKPPYYYSIDCSGFFGYWLGLNNYIIDIYALSDPFLARHKIIDTNKFRIGHFEREIPKDYVDSLQKHINCFKDSKEAHLYDLIVLATRSKDYFSKERLKAIFDLAIFNY